MESVMIEVPKREQVDCGRSPSPNRGLVYPPPTFRMIGDIGKLYKLEKKAEQAVKEAATELGRILKERAMSEGDIYRDSLPEEILHLMEYWGADCGISAAVTMLVKHGWTVTPPAAIGE